MALLINFITIISCQGLNIVAKQPQITHLEIHFHNTAIDKNGSTRKNPCKKGLHLPNLKGMMTTTNEKYS